MEEYLRRWMRDSLQRQQYDSAIFVGDKLVVLSDADDDVLALAQAHFHAANYAHALTSLLARLDFVHRSPPARYLAAHCHIKQNRHEAALALLGDKNPVHLASSPADAYSDTARRKLQHLTKKNGLGKQHTNHHETKQAPDGKKFEAGMCFLRGLCFAKQNAFERARQCYQDALRIDVQCFEALEQLVKNALMSPAEEWHFLDSLNFDSVTATEIAAQQPPTGDAQAAREEAAAFTRSLYTTRLAHSARPDDFAAALDTLASHYRLSTNADILLARADQFAARSQARSALAITSAILTADPQHFACLPLHLSLLYHLRATNALFALAHALADAHPLEPATWLAVGTYYLLTSRIPEARAFFSKASLLDPHSGPAWIGFAHTFAAEGESDQAIAAYSTAARLLPGSHAPLLFLGMQELALQNSGVAREYLTQAYQLGGERDPAVLNEMGVLAYREGEWDEAARAFALALSIAAEKCNGEPDADVGLTNAATRANLGHALRRVGRSEEALREFEEVVRLGERECGVFAAMGLCLLEMDRVLEAVGVLHEGLALEPQDALAGELLGKGLALLGEVGVLGGEEAGLLDLAVEGRVREIRARGGGRERRAREGRMDVDPAVG